VRQQLPTAQPGPHDLLQHRGRAARGRLWGYLSSEFLAWTDPNALEPTFGNKAHVAIWGQNQHMLIDSPPLCDFAFPRFIRSMRSLLEWVQPDDIVVDLELQRQLFAAVTGLAVGREQLDEVVARAFNLEREMLPRVGRRRDTEEALGAHFKLLCRADRTSIDQVGFSQLLVEYCRARGWELTLGWPQADTLQALGHVIEAEELTRRRLATPL
jgi:aldehyde:ferredoxin oxidoreductase